MGIPAADVFRVNGFLFGKSVIRPAEPLQTVAQTVLAALML